MARRSLVIVAFIVASLLTVAAACTRSVSDIVEGGPPPLGSIPGGGSLVFNPGGRGVAVVGGSTTPTLPPKAHPIVVVGGNVACEPEPSSMPTTAPATDRCQDAATFRTMLATDPDEVVALGDLQENAGAVEAFRAAYDLNWGTLRSRTRPVPGTAEYGTSGASGYFDYFNGAAGPYGKGWYSYDLGKWHFIALNSNCEEVGGCGPDSEQGRWLTQDLNAHRNSRCTLAYLNRPRFFSGTESSDDPTVAPLWDALADGGVDVVLASHQRFYERFDRIGKDGRPDPAGMASFVVGTGGAGHAPLGPARAGSQARNGDAFGVLQLTMLDGGLDYAFVPAAGATFTDQGHLDCR